MAQIQPLSPMDTPTSVRRASLATGASRRVISRDIRKGAIEAFRPGARTILVRPREVLRYLEQFRVRATDHADQVVTRRLEHEEGASAP